MSERLERRWFQFHLSTAMLVALVAGILMWSRVPFRNTRGGLVQSNWIQTNGLAARLSTSDSVLSVSGSMNLRLELKNNSDKSMTIKKSTGLGDDMDFFNSNGDKIRMEPDLFISGPPLPPRPADFVILQPGESTGHEITIRIEDRPGQNGLILHYDWNYFAPAGEIAMQATYHGYDCPTFWDDKQSKWIANDQVSGAPIWIGKAATDRIRMFIAPVWTARRILTNCAFGAAILIPLAFGCEWWIRRKERLNADRP